MRVAHFFIAFYRNSNRFSLLLQRWHSQMWVVQNHALNLDSPTDKQNINQLFEYSMLVFRDRWLWHFLNLNLYYEPEGSSTDARMERFLLLILINILWWFSITFRGSRLNDDNDEWENAIYASPIKI